MHYSDATPLAISPPTGERIIQAEHLRALIDAYLTEKARTAKRPDCAIGYEHNLAPFLSWWNECPEDHNYNLSATILDRFVKWARDEYTNSRGQRASINVLARATKQVRAVLRWGHDNGFIPVAIHELCPLITDPGRSKYFPEPHELYALINAAEGLTRLRDAALIAFSVSTGARRHEVANALAENVEFDTPITDVSIRSTHSGFVKLKVVKGDPHGSGLGRISGIDNTAGLLLKCYMAAAGIESGPLFGLTDQGIAKAVRTLGKRAGLPEIHPHAFRSALIDYWHDKHAEAGYLADIALRLHVGHAQDRRYATIHYIDLRNENKIKKRIRAYLVSPLQEMGFDWTKWPVHIPNDQH